MPRRVGIDIAISCWRDVVINAAELGTLVADWCRKALSNRVLQLRCLLVTDHQHRRPISASGSHLFFLPSAGCITASVVVAGVCRL